MKVTLKQITDLFIVRPGTPPEKSLFAKLSNLQCDLKTSFDISNILSKFKPIVENVQNQINKLRSEYIVKDENGKDKSLTAEQLNELEKKALDFLKEEMEIDISPLDKEKLMKLEVDQDEKERLIFILKP